MNPMLTALLEFNQAFEIPKLDAPGLGPDDLAELRVKLLREEVEEYAQALADGDLVEVLDALAAADVSLKRRERVEELARAAISRNRAAVDDDRLKRDEDILGMVLQNRRVEV